MKATYDYQHCFNYDHVSTSKKRYRLIQTISGQTYLWLAILIFGASSAVTRKLTEIGTHHFVDGRNPISLCNVLFVGNLCALIVMLLIYGRQWNKANLQQISRRDWMSLTAVAILSSALAPGLFFQALALTSVNNVILIGRVEPPLTLALSIWLLKERVSVWEFIGAIAAFFGVTLTIILQPPAAGMIKMAGLQLGLGELLVALASLAVAIATIISKKHLSYTPLGISSIFRTALGTLIFFFTALILYGSDHFADVLSPFLWQWMFLYGGLIVVVGQSLWTQGLKTSTVSQASLVGSFTPIVGIIAAYLILGEAPTIAQYIGGSLIGVGIFVSQVGKRYQMSRKKVAVSQITSVKAEKEAEIGMGFKGV